MLAQEVAAVCAVYDSSRRSVRMLAETISIRRCFTAVVGGNIWCLYRLGNLRPFCSQSIFATNHKQIMRYIPRVIVKRPFADQRDVTKNIRNVRKRTYHVHSVTQERLLVCHVRLGVGCPKIQTSPPALRRPGIQGFAFCSPAHFHAGADPSTLSTLPQTVPPAHPSRLYELETPTCAADEC